MRFDKVECQGKFWIQTGDHASVRHRSSIDAGRVLYDSTDEHLYFGTSSDWKKVAGLHDVFEIYTTTLFGNIPLPQGWNIITNKNDCCVFLTSTGGEIGSLAGDWVITGFDSQGAHDHGGVSGEAIGSWPIGKDHNEDDIQIQQHTHTIPADGLHSHDFTPGWRPAYMKFVEGRYSI